MIRLWVFAAATAVLAGAIATEVYERLFPDRPFVLFLVCATAVMLGSLATVAFASRSAATERSGAPAGPEARTPSSEERETGTVKWFNRSKGFGFIIRDNGGEIFVHHNALEHTDRRTLRDGQRVSFVVVSHKKGLQAEHVMPVVDPRQ